MTDPLDEQEFLLPTGLRLDISIQTLMGDDGNGETGPSPWVDTQPISWSLVEVSTGRVIAQATLLNPNEWVGINGDPVQFLDHYVDEDEARQIRGYLHEAGLY